MYGDGRKLLVGGAYSTMEVALRVIYNNFIPHSVKQKGLFLSNHEFLTRCTTTQLVHIVN